MFWSDPNVFFSGYQPDIFWWIGIQLMGCFGELRAVQLCIARKSEKSNIYSLQEPFLFSLNQLHSFDSFLKIFKYLYLWRNQCKKILIPNISFYNNQTQTRPTYFMDGKHYTLTFELLYAIIKNKRTTRCYINRESILEITNFIGLRRPQIKHRRWIPTHRISVGVYRRLNIFYSSLT